MSYTEDGNDTVNYSGAGAVHIIASQYPVEHKVSDFISFFDGGTDQLFSIETVTWDTRNDTVTAGPGVDLIEIACFLSICRVILASAATFLACRTVTRPLLVNVADQRHPIRSGRSQ